jgi:flagellar hook-length control protein FliK
MLQQLATAKSEVATFASQPVVEGGVNPDPQSSETEQGYFGRLLSEQQNAAGAQEKKTLDNSNPQASKNSLSSVDKKTELEQQAQTTEPVETSEQTHQNLKSAEGEKKPKLQDGSTLAAQVSETKVSEARVLELDTEEAHKEELTSSNASSQLSPKGWFASVESKSTKTSPEQSVTVHELGETFDNAPDAKSTEVLANPVQLAEVELAPAELESLDTDESNLWVSLVEKFQQFTQSDKDSKTKPVDVQPELSQLAALIKGALDEQTGIEQSASGEAVEQKVVAKLLADPQALEQAFAGFLSGLELDQNGQLQRGDDAPKLDLALIAEWANAELTESGSALDTESVIISEEDIQLGNSLLDTPLDTPEPESVTNSLESSPISAELLVNDVDVAVSPTELTAVASVSQSIEKQLAPELKDQSIVEEIIGSEAAKPTDNQGVAGNTAISRLVNMPEDKLDRILTKIAEHALKNEQEAQQSSQSIQLKTDAVADALVVKDFVSVLKAGVGEFKQQLAQGREPGIDLKALVSDAATKVAELHPGVKMPENIEQNIANVSQMFEFASSLTRSVEQQTANYTATYSSVARDVAQIQGEQAKQVQTSQLEQKFEKAVNITKADGLQELSEKVRWLANAKNLVAEIRLDPAELGAMQVRVALSGESATVNFIVQSQHAREAMEQAAPRLKEMLAEKGIELGQSSVQQESNNNQQQDEAGAERGFAGHQDSSEASPENQSQPEQVIVNGALGGIDYFV